MVDALDAHYVMGNFSEFKRAVQLVIKNVQFNSDSIIQVFEVSLNALISCYTVIPPSAGYYPYYRRPPLGASSAHGFTSTPRD